MIATVPAIGSMEVDPELSEIRVTFDQKMADSFSWTRDGEYFPAMTGAPYWEAGGSTCVLPVRLNAGAFVRVGINSSNEQDFKSRSGVPAEFMVIYFTTKGASAETRAKLIEPLVRFNEPPNSAMSVPASTDRLIVTFDHTMGPGSSWTYAGGRPTQLNGSPSWSADRTTCTLPVKLEPNKTYSIGLNGAFANDFQSVSGVPLAPVVWTFTTAE